MKTRLIGLFLLAPAFLLAQELDSLTVEKIMRAPEWFGTSPSEVFWGPKSENLYFKWNPEEATSDSLYCVSMDDPTPRKPSYQDRQMAEAEKGGNWNFNKTKLAFVEDHTLYLLDVETGDLKTLARTSAEISNPNLKRHDSVVVYRKDENLFAKNIETGRLTQLTDFKEGQEEEGERKSDQEKFLEEDALNNSEILRQRKEEKEEAERIAAQNHEAATPKTIHTGDKSIRSMTTSPDNAYVIYELAKIPEDNRTIVPDYVTQSGYTKGDEGRSTVGMEQPGFESYIYDRAKDTVFKIDPEQIPGIHDIPKFMDDYPDKKKDLEDDLPLRSVYISKPYWNDAGNSAFVVIRAQDHKDRWLMRMDVENGDLDLLDRQHDDAWIGGPGIGYSHQDGNLGWIDDKTIYYQSEKSGYSHLYTMNVKTGDKKALTEGEYEVQEVELSPDKETFYLTTNQEDPGITQYYHLDVASGEQTQITSKKGGHDVAVSPDGKHLAYRFSTITDPWELYVQDNQKEADKKQVTDKAESEEYQSYDWQTPEIITFEDRDGYDVRAKVYQPEEQAETKPGVVFVHGAGYLQDVMYYWSDAYFREHFFMNLLASQGYTVMDIDYRGSAGYGRDWRTAIYRHMGKNDLADVVDGAHYMADNFDVNPDKIGIWGGSYGGFMTLTALFKTDDFAAGGALRSVTDWAHYNHEYTSNILNLPQNDSIAYQQSSPINFAKGLDDPLQMAHGVVDPNVHFQDIVRLNQKLIELGKKDWDLAIYPVEGHAFEEASSWTDEYRRILELFERYLK